MADTVKKSRIVSEDEDNLEEALLEEFNMRLKNCMSKNDLQTADETFYENVSENSKPIPKIGVASYDFIESERHHFYDTPTPIIKNGGTKTHQNGHDTVEETENIYETLPEIEKTEPTDQEVEISTPEIIKPNLILDLSPKIEVEPACYEDVEEAGESGYEIVEEIDRPTFTMNTTDFSELKSPEDTAKSVKDRMFLATDDAATLLFTQTVTSPMLTPSEENIDFLKGFQRESTASDATSSNDSPPKEDASKASEGNSASDISPEASTSEPLPTEETKPIEEENIYENAEFLKRNTESIYENLKEVSREENIYENLKDVKDAVKELEEEQEEHIYQDIDECVKEEDVYESVGDVEENQKTSPDEVMVNNCLYLTLEEMEPHADVEAGGKDVGTEQQYEQVGEKSSETSETMETKTIVSNEETVESNTDDSIESKITETYSEFIHHSKTESNYYEKYTEVVSKSNVDIGNREKDTETVPAEIVKNLKNQFSKGGVEVVAITKKETEDVGELRTINIMKQITKFEQSGDGMPEEPEDSTVTESYTETTTIQSDVPEEKSLKKKKIKKSRKEEKENISVKSSFSKFDALQKKNVLHIRSSDSTKAQEKFNGTQLTDTTNCKACSKQVFQMEQIKAEKAIWHKNCFRCTECSKQLTVETYVSHEGNLYCKPHFKSLFAPKVVEDETPPSDKPDLGLEELQSLNVKERFQVFEHHQTEQQESDRTTAVNVKRSPSILSKLARFQAKGMDVGVSDDALNGIPIEESSSEEEEVEEEVPEGEDPTLYKAKKVQKEKPFHFTNLNEVKNKWEQGEQNSRDERREERKQEIQSIRNKLFLGKQGKMKEAYQQAVMQSESCTNLVKSEKIESCDTRSLKERFEKGESLNEKETKSGDDEDTEVFQSEISKKSRSLFLELDANASKAPQLSPVTTQKQDIKKTREAYLAKTASQDTVKSSETIEDVVEVKTADIQQRFKFFETYKEPEKERKQFRITPPRDPSQVKTDTPDREIYHDPEVVRAEDTVDDSVIAKTTHTASKMLNKFRQMEENMSKEPEQVGPKPLKRFTPPPEPTRPESESEEEYGSEEESDGDEDQIDNNKLPEDLLEAQKAARAKQLRAKFEKWEAQEIKREQTQSVNIVEEYGEESQIESTKSLRARFESMRDSSSDNSRTQRVKVNRFV